MRLTIIGVLSLVLFCSACSHKKQDSGLPYLGNFDVEQSTVDGVKVSDTIYPTIPSFTYRNQHGDKVKASDMKGKVWVTDFFFSTCPTICPIMTTQMKRLNTMTADINEHIQYLSFSINPNHDQPEVLTKYIEHHGIEATNWNFLTGNEAETHALGVDYFLVHAASDENSPGGYAHSPAFVLVDQEGYVRGVYIGTDTKEVDKLEKDLRKLLSVEYGVE